MQGKVHAIAHDSAANIIAALRLIEDVDYSICCAAHTLQTCVKHALKSVEAFTKILKKASSLVSHFHHSNVATHELEKKQKQLGLKNLKLLQSCPTRWDSSYSMCERLLCNRAAVTPVLADRTITSPALALKH